MASLTMNQLEKSFAQGKSRRRVLHGIDLTLNDNEFVSIVGVPAAAKAHCYRLRPVWRSLTAAMCWWMGNRFPAQDWIAA